MSTQVIVERILSDARAEAQGIVAEAEEKAAKLLADASTRLENARQQTEREVLEKRKSIFEKHAANARLDSAKLLLGEKRKVVDMLYAQALGRLQDLSKEDCLKLTEDLLEKYAEQGDVICFAEGFRYQTEVAALPVVKSKALKISSETLSIAGGMRLLGEKSDKDLSYEGLLAADREEYQAALAAEIFK